MKPNTPDHYAVLGLHRTCNEGQIRTAYRVLAKRHHPDLHPDSHDAMLRIQALNEAYATLGDAARRQDYDKELARQPRAHAATPRHAIPPIRQDVSLSLQDFLRGTSITVTIRDPSHPEGSETYPLEIPPDTAPGTRFRIRRHPPLEGGALVVRVKARPDYRFKVKGSDLRADLNITAALALRGGRELLRGMNGAPLYVDIPARTARGALLRIVGEGLPKARGGRGDLVVRITYRPAITINRESPHGERHRA